MLVAARRRADGESGDFPYWSTPSLDGPRGTFALSSTRSGNRPGLLERLSRPGGGGIDSFLGAHSAPATRFVARQDGVKVERLPKSSTRNSATLSCATLPAAACPTSGRNPW